MTQTDRHKALRMFIMKNIIFLLILCPLLSFGTKIAIVAKSNESIVQYSASELKTFLDEKNGFEYISQEEKADWVITLLRDKSLKEGSFRVTSTLKGKHFIQLRGATNNEILYAVYTFLEKLGFVFEISGPYVPEKINVDAINIYSETIIPVVKYRGIRQHLNFPMDISSYSQMDAKKYIQNLARMRFNHITFHSYPGQWYKVTKKDTIEYAGNFFYGEKLNMPDNPFIQRNVHNNKIFCIPEIEPYYDSIAVKSKLAINWLNEVMKEAKRVGMRVQFSFEPRSKSTNVDETIAKIEQIQQQYPLLDAIEMTTEEAGGWGPVNSANETKEILVSFFGNEILNDAIVTTPIKSTQTDLGYLYGEIGHNLKVIEAVRKKKIQTPLLKLGIYSVVNDYSIPAYHLARKFAPVTEVSILSSYGSGNVARVIPQIISDKKDWDETTVYSWLEFDGMMFLQQNGIQGIYNLVKNRMEQAPDSRFNTIAFNHWRTAENKITARYASLSTLFGAIEPARFYEDYAKELGIASPSSFTRAMLLLQEAFDSKSSNMGFAWMGSWKNGINFEPSETLKGALALYESARKELSKCSHGNANAYAKNTVQFLDNRLRTTIIYYQAFIKQNELKTPDLTVKRYSEICNEVLSMFDVCLKTYSEMMPDRGCEGTLLDLYICPVRAVKISRQKKTGIPIGEPADTTNIHFDAPGVPIFN